MGEFDDEPFAKPVLERFDRAHRSVRLAADRIWINITSRFLSQTTAFMFLRELWSAHSRRGTGAVSWGVGYRRGTFLFCHGDSYHYVMPTETMDEVSRNLHVFDENVIDEYLTSRASGANDWISFQQPSRKKAAQSPRPEHHKKGKVFGLFTNVIWDAQLHFKDVFFENMLDWLFSSIEHFLKHPEQRLVIRIHPAEMTGTVPSRQPVLKEIRSRFGELPGNIEVIEPDNDLTSYDVMQRIDYALVFGSKMAAEIAAAGTPVIICGDSWARGKGFSVDVVSRDHYRDILTSPQSHVRLPKNFPQLAKQYAHYLFFER